MIAPSAPEFQVFNRIQPCPPPAASLSRPAAERLAPARPSAGRLAAAGRAGPGRGENSRRQRRGSRAGGRRARARRCSVNAAAPMNPASVMKLVTTYAALELLGPAYRWKTEAYAAGALQDGVLDGDLVLKGSGDPKLDLEAFWRLVRALRGKGLREIRGDLVVDRSHFERARGRRGPLRRRSVPPLQRAARCAAGELQVAALRLRRRTRARGGADLRRAAAAGAGGGQRAASSRDGACPDGSAFREMLKPTFEPARQRAIFSGQYPGQLRREGPERRAARAQRPGRGRDAPVLERERRRLERQCARRNRCRPARGCCTRSNRRRSPRSCATPTSSPTTSWRATCS